MSIDVMKQVLEVMDTVAPSFEASAPRYYSAREALRAAIEQVQEPVAWMYDLKQRGSFEGVSTEYSRVKLSIGENWVPLYTAPPQRKPLKLREIEKCIYDANNDPIVACRNVEVAHGIKGEA